MEPVLGQIHAEARDGAAKHMEGLGCPAHGDVMLVWCTTPGSLASIVL